MLILDFFGFFGEYHFYKKKSKIFHCTYYVLLHLTISTRFWNVFRFSAMFNRQLYLVKVLLALLFLFLYYAFCVISMGILNLSKFNQYFTPWLYDSVVKEDSVFHTCMYFYLRGLFCICRGQP